jgi:protein phosphatase
LLCSDGLTAKVEDHEIGAVLGNLPPREAAQMLVDIANLRGGPDNITAIVIQIIALPSTTGHASTAPLTVGTPRATERTVHPLLWVAMGVSWLVGLAMLVVAQPVAALIAFLIGIVAVAAVVLQRFGRGVGVTLAGRRRLGKGPYSRTPSELDAGILDRLEKIVDDVRQHLGAESWSEGENARESDLSEARQLATQKELVPALAHYARALHTLIATVRAHEQDRASDSSIELF